MFPFFFRGKIGSLFKGKPLPDQNSTKKIIRNYLAKNHIITYRYLYFDFEDLITIKLVLWNYFIRVHFKLFGSKTLQLTPRLRFCRNHGSRWMVVSCGFNDKKNGKKLDNVGPRWVVFCFSPPRTLFGFDWIFLLVCS